MNKTDVLTGRIVQRVIDTKNEAKKFCLSRVSVVHGVDNSHDVNKLMDNLFEFFPDGLITLRKLKYGYELRIEVDF